MSRARTRRHPIDRGDIGVIALVLGAAGHVDDAAVGVVGMNGKLLVALAGNNALRGEDSNLGDCWIRGIATRRAAGDPATNQLIFIGAYFEATAARVRNGARRFLEQQTEFRCRR